jgi:hypothetical protein
MKYPTVVTWTLKPTSNGTKLTLKHEGFEGLKLYAVGVLLSMGWDRLLRKKLATLLEVKFNR